MLVASGTLLPRRTREPTRGRRWRITLADLLVSIAVLGLLLGVTAVVLQHGQESYFVGAARVEVQQGVRAALERMAAEIREAGTASTSVAFDAIVLAEPARVTIQHDLDGDGVIGANGEQITYVLAGSTLRRDAGGGAQPVLDGVTHLRLTYLDRSRQPATAPGTVRWVGIELAAGPATGGRPLPFPVGAHASTEVRLRNRP